MAQARILTFTSPCWGGSRCTSSVTSGLAAYLAGEIRETMKIIFLDIDGVLNDSSEPIILPECASHFKRIVKETEAKVVISSGWRRWVHGGLMTDLGFQQMLRTHCIVCQVVGVTPADGKVQGRGKQIAAWLAENGPVDSYVVIDDDNHDFRECGHPFVKTDGTKGLSEQDAVRAIELLNGNAVQGQT